MKKFLLINPELPITEGPKFNVPMGLLHLGSYLEAHGVKVRLIDCNVEDDAEAILKNEISTCIVVGISAMTAQLPSALKLAKVVKGVNPNIPVVFGGVHATLFPEQTINNSRIDFIVIGEGEIPALELFKALESGMSTDKIGGIGYKDKLGSPVINPKIEEFDYEDMPRINYNLLKENVVKQFKERYIGMLTSRGCPHRCAFCINTIIKEKKKWKAWHAQRIADEVDFLIKRGYSKIWFWDENFFVSKKRVIEFIEEIERRGLKFEWFANVRADYFNANYLNMELLKRLHKIGCRKFGIGAESGSQKVLDYLNKDISVDFLLDSAELCKHVGIEPTYSFIIGLPNETKDDNKQTIQVMSQLSKICPFAKFLGPQLYRPYPGGSLYVDCLMSGFKEPKNLEEWSYKIQNEFMSSNAFDMTWIKEPRFVNTVWFYSVLIALDFKTLLRLYHGYCRQINKNLVAMLLGSIGIIVMSTLGKFRYNLDFHLLQIEIYIFKRWRSVLSY